MLLNKNSKKEKEKTTVDLRLKERLKEKIEGEIIALDDAKNYVHANGNFDDELIKTLIKSGREIIEKILHQSILKERWIGKYFRTEFLNKKSTTYPLTAISPVLVTNDSFLYPSSVKIFKILFDSIVEPFFNLITLF